MEEGEEHVRFREAIEQMVKKEEAKKEEAMKEEVKKEVLKEENPSFA